MPKVTIALPAYQAETTLAMTVAAIPDGVADELILVDDASTDGTVGVSRGLGIATYVHDRNRGYGGNQKTCYLRALEHETDIVVLLHPDYQYDPGAVPLLIGPIVSGHADMTFGSRFAGLGDPLAGGMPLYRYMGNRVTTVAENALLGSRFTELHSGMRAYSRRCLLRLPFLGYSDDFAFDSQLLVDAVTSGLRVVEVPIPTRYTLESSSISVKRSLRYVASSLNACVQGSAARGRRGRRWPVAGTTLSAPRSSGGERVAQECVLCHGPWMERVLKSNTTAPADVTEFSCTSNRLAEHDDILRCPHCGMISSRPALKSDELVDMYASSEDVTYMDEAEARRELFGWVLDRIGSYALGGRRLFEAGANVGLFLEVAGARGWRARGVEPSRRAVAEGRRRFGVDLAEGTVEGIDPAGESSDAVVMLDVLEHVADPVAALSALRRVVADEGLLALTTINCESLHSRVRRGSWPWYIRPHLHYFTPATLRRTMEQAGFDMVDYRIVPRSFHLSYVVDRGRHNLGLAGRLGAGFAEVWDPRLPFGLLGDVVLAVGRPRPA
jgi:2-polyprenyl-3-methyl-5-hydroxy-6-metoxy-1,4-benzoquinol methylase